MAKLIEIRQPEGGFEHQVVYETHHRCPQGNALHAEMGDDVDLLVFPVGQVGFGMPRDEPFVVEAMEKCQACGRTLSAGFVWRRGHVNHAGSIWMP